MKLVHIALICVGLATTSVLAADWFTVRVEAKLGSKSIVVSEQCLNGYKYYMTDQGGIAPKLVQHHSRGSFGHSASFERC